MCTPKSRLSTKCVCPVHECFDVRKHCTKHCVAGIELSTAQALNQALRSADRQLVRPFFPYIRLLMAAFDKLPKHKGQLNRGVKLALGHLSKYQQGSDFVEWSAILQLRPQDMFTAPASLLLRYC